MDRVGVARHANGRCAALRIAALCGVAALAACGGSDGRTDLEPVRWLAVGDSFASGEGTDEATGACGQSTGAYAHLAAATLADDDLLEDLTFSACTGAVIADVEAQVADVGATRFDVVTVSVGGNDAGYASVLADCLGADDLLESAAGFFGRDEEPPTLSLRECDTSGEELSARVALLTEPLKALYQRIVDDHLSEDGRLFVVGYPNLFEEPDAWPADEGERCDGISRADAASLRAVAAELNAMLAALAEEVGAAFIDTAATFEGHGRCSEEPFFNGFDVIPRVKGSFHPNDAGHRAFAALVVDAIKTPS